MVVAVYSLINVPFDNQYRNVFTYHKSIKDVGFTKRELKYDLAAVYERTYPSVVKTIDNRGLKTYYNDTTITISKNKTVVMDYNYMILYEEDDTPHFFFITGVVSENDSPSNPSTTITLERDVWSSNIYELTYNTSINNIVQKHYDRFELVGQTMHWKNIQVNAPKHKEHIENVLITGERYKLLSMVLVINENGIEEGQFKGLINYYNDLSETVVSPEAYVETEFNIHPIGTLRFKKNLIYIPFAVYDTVNNAFGNYKLRGIKSFTRKGFITGGGQQSYEHFNSVDININQLNLPPIESSIVDRAYLSYEIPFKYTVDNVNNIVNIEALVFKTSINSKYEKIYSAIGYPFESGNPYESEDYVNFENEYLRWTNTTTFYPEDNAPPSTKDRYKFSNDNPELELALYNYPFNYYNLICGDLRVPLVSFGQYTDFTYILYRWYRTSQVGVTINNSGTILNDYPLLLRTSGDVTYSSQAKDDYLIRNGSQVNTALGMSLLNGSISVLGSALSKDPIGTVKSGIKPINDIANYTALMNDLNNTPNIVNNEMGENDVIVQDRIIITKHSMIKDKLYETYKNSFYMYGYEIPEYGDILSDCRLSFDYCKTANCSLNLQIPIEDRNVIEAAFDRGIFKHHILHEAESYMSFILNPTLSFDSSEINNIESKFKMDSPYYDWVNS